MRERRPRRRSDRLSLVFAGLAVVLIVTAVLLARRGNDGAPAPTPGAAPGHNEMLHVFNALKQQRLTVAFARTGVPLGELTVPGQALTVDGMPLYVFIYPDVDQAAAEASGADPAAVLPTASSAGTPIAIGRPHVVSHSNVTVVLVGGSDEVTAKVDRAIQGLP